MLPSMALGSDGLTITVLPEANAGSVNKSIFSQGNSTGSRYPPLPTVRGRQRYTDRAAPVVTIRVIIPYICLFFRRH
jgi:hypothetical protein